MENGKQGKSCAFKVFFRRVETWSTHTLTHPGEHSPEGEALEGTGSITADLGSESCTSENV